MDSQTKYSIADSVKKNVELYIFNLQEDRNSVLMSITKPIKVTNSNGDTVLDNSTHYSKYQYILKLIAPCLSYSDNTGFPILRILFDKERFNFRNIQEYIQFKLGDKVSPERDENPTFMDGDD